MAGSNRPRPSSGARLLGNILRNAGFKTQLEHPVLKYYVDIYLPEHHVGIEYDGHRHTLKWEKDLARQADIEQAGLPLLRFNIKDVGEAKKNPRRLLRQVRKFIRERGIGKKSNG